MRRVALFAAITATIVFGLVAAGLVPVAVATDENATVTTYRAVDVTSDDLENADEIESLIADGSIENASAMVWTETLVVAIEDEQLPASESTNGAEGTNEFFDALEDADADLRLYQTNPTPETGVTEVPLGPENTTIYRDGTVTYAVVEPGFPVADEQDVWDREAFGVAYGTEHEPYPMDEPMRFYESKAEVRHLSDGDPLPTETMQRDVEVNVPADEGVDVRLELEGEARTATVGPSPDGGFEFDLADVDPGTGYELELRHDGTVIETYAGSVENPAGELEVIDVGETTVDGTPARNLTLDVALSHGGTVRITDADDDLHYRERLDPGTNRTLTVPDGDRTTLPTDEEIHVHLEREPPLFESHYPGNSPAAVIDGNGSVTEGESIVDQDDTGPGTERATDGNETGTARNEPSVDETPGFGIGAAGLAVAVGVILVARRTDTCDVAREG